MKLIVIYKKIVVKVSIASNKLSCHANHSSTPSNCQAFNNSPSLHSIRPPQASKKTKHIHKQMREKNKQQTKKYITKGGIIIIIISHL